MRDFKGMKRQRGRNRGGGGGGNKPQNANRAFDSNGPDGVKVRGNAQHVFEKYQQLARDASSASDRVLAENYLQHAEHYFRLLRAMQPQRPASEILGRDNFAGGFDIDFEDESIQAQAEAADEAAAEGASAAEPAEGETRDRWQGERRDRDERPRNDRSDNRREDRSSREDRAAREDRPPREDRQDGRRDRWQNDRPRADRFESRRDRDERPERAPREDAAEPATEERPGRVLRDAEGGESHAPAFLQTPAAPRPEAAEDEPARKPRRRRAPRSFEGGENASPASETEEA